MCTISTWRSWKYVASCRQWLRDSWGHNYVALSRGSRFWFVHLWSRKLCQRPTLTLKVTQNNNMMNSRRILGCTYDSDAWLFLHESRLPGFSSEEKSNLTSIDGWCSPGLSDFPVKFLEATKCGGASGSAKARFSMFAWKTVWNQNQILFRKWMKMGGLHDLGMLLVPGCWLSLAIDMTSSTHTPLASIQL